MLPESSYDKCVGLIDTVGGDRFLYCTDCFRYRAISPSCNQRNCPRCQLKQSRRLFNRYFHALKRKLRFEIGFTRRLIMVTLTGFNVSHFELGEKLKALLRSARSFLKMKYRGGLIAAEHTFHEAEGEYFIHVHALVHGDYHDVKEMSAEWGRFVWLQDALHYRGRVRTLDEGLSAGLLYMLKYIAKGFTIDDADLEQVKRIRYISTFGDWYNMEMPRIVSRCKACHGKITVGTEDDIDTIHKDRMGSEDSWHDAFDERGNIIGEYKEPLELEMVISWRSDLSEKVKNALEVQQEGLRRRYERWKERNWMALLVHWCEDRVLSILPSYSSGW